jgi:transposase-like protein
LICPRCRIPMREEKRSYHKQRKWICPACGKVRMQQIRKQRGKDN